MTLNMTQEMETQPLKMNDESYLQEEDSKRFSGLEAQMNGHLSDEPIGQFEAEEVDDDPFANLEPAHK